MVDDAPRPERSPASSPREHSIERLLSLLELAETALTDLCDAWDYLPTKHDGGKYRGNVTNAHHAARKALAALKARSAK